MEKENQIQKIEGKYKKYSDKLNEINRSPEEVQNELEAILSNGSDALKVERAYELLGYSKDKGYVAFPNGRSLGEYDGLVFDKAMEVMKKNG